MNVYGTISGTLSTPMRIIGTLAGAGKIIGTLTIPSSFANTYEGAYTFTPSEETQVVQTADLMLIDDLTINPIPSNYGLITYNGVSITVS